MSTITDWIQRQKKICEAATPAPWVMETPMPETLSIIHEPTKNCPNYDWKFIADVPAPENEEEQDLPPKETLGNAEFIMSARTSLPLALEMLEVTLEALRNIPKIPESQHNLFARNELTKIGGMVK